MPRSSYLCANPDCAMQLLDIRSVTPGELPDIDDIIVCGACRHASVITAIATRPLTEAELDKVPHEVRADLRFANRALDAKIKQN